MREEEEEEEEERRFPGEISDVDSPRKEIKADALSSLVAPVFNLPFVLLSP